MASQVGCARKLNGHFWSAKKRRFWKKKQCPKYATNLVSKVEENSRRGSEQKHQAGSLLEVDFTKTLLRILEESSFNLLGGLVDLQH